MEKFKFRFASVLRVRKSREDQALLAFSTAQKSLQAEIQRKESLAQELQASQIRKETLAGEAVSVISLQMENDFIKGTVQRISQAGQAIMRAQRGVEKALRFYLTTKRQTRAIEILYDKSLAEYKKAASKDEQKKIDEMVVMRFASQGFSESDDLVALEGETE